jgi:hypothetical protein
MAAQEHFERSARQPYAHATVPLTVSRLTALGTGASSILPGILGNSCSGNAVLGQPERWGLVLRFPRRKSC